MWARLREHLKGWKTVVIGSVTTGAGVVLEILDFLGTIDLRELLPATAVPLILLSLGILKIALRFATTGPVGSKDGLP